MYDHFTKTRGITVTEVTDSAEVWVMTVIDTNRLNSFVCTEDETEIGGFSGFSKLVNAYRLEFTELEFLREGIQTIFKKITYFDFQTPNKYSFEIPNEVMKSNSFEVLHDYLKHILGIKLHKEMRLEKFKLIDFHK